MVLTRWNEGPVIPLDTLLSMHDGVFSITHSMSMR